jgi:hypothetical protein
LRAGEPNASVFVYEKFRPSPNRNQKQEIEEKYPRQKERDVRLLIAQDSRRQSITNGPGAVTHAHMNQAKIIKEERSADRNKSGADSKPRR